VISSVVLRAIRTSHLVDDVVIDVYYSMKERESRCGPEASPMTRVLVGDFPTLCPKHETSSANDDNVP
jgi:hypothetical protein